MYIHVHRVQAEIFSVNHTIFIHIFTELTVKMLKLTWNTPRQLRKIFRLPFSPNFRI